MIDQHLYLIVPDEYSDGQNVGLPMDSGFSFLIQLGWKIPGSTTCVVRIAQVNGKSAHHLYFSPEGWAELTAEIAYQSGIANPWTRDNIVAAEPHLCIAPGVMICVDLDHLKARDADFAGKVSGVDPDTGEPWERDVVIDTTIMP